MPEISKAYAACVKLMARGQQDAVLELVFHDKSLHRATDGDLCLVRQAVLHKLGPKFIRRLIDAGVSPNVIDSTGATPLIDASANGDHSLIRTLLECGAEVNQQSFMGETAFSFACANNHLRCARMLYFHGADINVQIGHPPSSTPLDWAERYASKHFEKWLRSIGGVCFAKTPPPICES